jgi:ABC-2 type transport system ATP-binding protein
MRLLGPPLMELRLASSLNGAAKLVSDLARVEAQGEDWLRFSTPNPHETNPLVLRALAAQGVGVVTMSQVPRSLEDVYLRVIEG